MGTTDTTETAMLILQRGGNEAGRRWLLDKQNLTIGRADDCDIVLPDRLVSRHHARVYWIEGHYYVEDLGSKNGTHVNGQEVTEPRMLEDGDEIQIALRFKLAFVDAGATAPLSFGELEEPGLRLEHATRQVFVRGRELTPPLSVAQYRLLDLLISAQGGVVTREEVVRAVWPEAMEEGVSEQAIDALVRRLRERIAELDPDHQYIVTVRGHGFRLENRE
ncbi:MAG: FHA domain-containing protein [Anaerolineae bacterium]|nr:FHA domain-containing protein [Anaerolineae bacterium]